MIFGNLFGGGDNVKPIKYENSPGFDFSSEYAQTMGLSGADARGYNQTLLDAVDRGNLDQRSALSMLDSRLAPGQTNTGPYEELLNYQMGEDRATRLIEDAYSSNLFRGGTADEIASMYDRARAAGVLNDPNELRQFATSTLARTPEGQDKRPIDDYQRRMASYYGAPVIDSQGRNTGQYRVFGYDDAKYEAAAGNQQKTQEFTSGFLDKLGARGSLA